MKSARKEKDEVRPELYVKFVLKIKSLHFKLKVSSLRSQRAWGIEDALKNSLKKAHANFLNCENHAAFRVTA